MQKLALALGLVVSFTSSYAAAQACTTSATCGGRACVDGQCCNTACGGGDTRDCQACSVAAGAPTNGTCATLTAGRVCRPDQGLCDVEDVCNGISTSCAETVVPAFPTVVCRPATLPCDVQEVCDGANPLCPDDAFQPPGYLCRYDGPCDLPENCNGVMATCPLPDLRQPDRISCIPTAPTPCVTAYQCMSGVCEATVGCVDLDICTLDECVGSTCVHTPMAGCDGGGPLIGDAGPRVDGGGVAMDGGGSPADAGGSAGCGGAVCPCPRPADACDVVSDCDAGEVCVDGVCGEHTCVAAGADCTTVDDCPAGSACTGGVCTHPGTECTTTADCDGALRCEEGPTGVMECVGNDCTTSTTCPSGALCIADVCVEAQVCVDERDCPLGFGCEPASASVSLCIDRRPPCVRDDDCPFGFLCEVPSASGGGFCRRVVVRCESTQNCQAGEECIDVDGDGETECQPTDGTCQTNADCDGEVCGVSPTTGEPTCGAIGPCDPDMSDCPAGTTCTALDPGGVPECVFPRGTCDDDSDCLGGQVCATLAEGRGPECYEGVDPDPPPADAAVRFDAGPDRAEVGGGGCVCTAAGHDRPSLGNVALSMLALAGVLLRRTRRRAPETGRRHLMR